MIYCVGESALLFDPRSRTKKVLSNSAREFHVNYTHNTFITIDTDSKLSIYYKNESVYSHENAFGKYLSSDGSLLVYFQEIDGVVSVCVLDLQTLKHTFLVELKGEIECATLSEDVFHVLAHEDKTYSVLTVNVRTGVVEVLETFNTENAVYSALNPNGTTIAVAMDHENDTEIALIDL